VVLAGLVRSCEVEPRFGRQATLAVFDRIPHPDFSDIPRSRPGGHYRAIAGFNDRSDAQCGTAKEKPPCGGFASPMRRKQLQFWNCALTYQNWPAIGYSVPSRLFRSQEKQTGGSSSVRFCTPIAKLQPPPNRSSGAQPN
jgi:hypothetical protein